MAVSAHVLAADGASGGPGASGAKENVLQFLIDPKNADQAWLLTDQTLQRNGGLKAGQKWVTKFDKAQFQKLTGEDPGREFRNSKLQFSKKANGGLLLLVENIDPKTHQARKFVFTSLDQGESWISNQPREPAQPPPPENPYASTPGNTLPRDVPTEKTPLEAPPPKSATAPLADDGMPDRSVFGLGAAGATAGVAGTPLLRGLFDFWFEARGGGQPLTFDSYHTTALAEVAVARDMTFAFEIAASPRLYELMYRVNPRLEVRAGRIWIPFDSLNGLNSPNYWGGFASVGNFRDPGAQPFLPDIWSDLGVSVKYRLSDSRVFDLDGTVYVVNGFGSAGTDPTGQVTGRYPNFTNAGTVDNNSDKALGFRLAGSYAKRLTLGVSGYEGRYTDEGDVDRRILIFGADVSWRFLNATEFRAGYAGMSVGLPPPAGDSSFTRQGAYAEIAHGFLDRWKFTLRTSGILCDSRLLTNGDQELLGAILAYQMKPFNLSFVYFHDFQKMAGKTAYDLTALRAMLIF